MIIKRYLWDDENSPILPHLDSVLQKFDKSIVVQAEDNKVLGYAGLVEDEARYDINSFWAGKKNPVVQKALLDELKKELNFEKQKRMGMNIDKEDESFIKLLQDSGWYVHLSDPKKDIYEPSRACYQLSLTPDVIEELREINEHKKD